ncbi:hypothetical protein SSCG_06179 [Streptomyces clavuligerus]|nr:hypothetical protein SSCG_06179 [Streptomyces clavuligerus]
MAVLMPAAALTSGVVRGAGAVPMPAAVLTPESCWRLPPC